MTIHHSPDPVAGSKHEEDARVDVAGLTVQVKEMHEEVKELVIALEKLRHRLDRVEHQFANPE